MKEGKDENEVQKGRKKTREGERQYAKMKKKKSENGQEQEGGLEQTAIPLSKPSKFQTWGAT